MEYENYFFESKSIKGNRVFLSNNGADVLEEFSGINESTESDLHAEYSGAVQHTLTMDGDSLISFTSTGEINGVNAAGRDFEISIVSTLVNSAYCFQQNEILPNTGKANWVVSRGGDSNVTYTVTYEQLIEECKVAVNAILPDGKKLLLNQSN